MSTLINTINDHLRASDVISMGLFIGAGIAILQFLPTIIFTLGG